MVLALGVSDEMSAGWLPCPWPSSLPENVFWPSEAPLFFRAGGSLAFSVTARDASFEISERTSGLTAERATPDRQPGRAGLPVEYITDKLLNWSICTNDVAP